MKAVVLGCGLAGLGAALHLLERGHEVLVLEKGHAPGGLATTDCVGDFRFDRVAQFLHFRSDHLRHRLQQEGLALQPIRRQAAIVVEGTVVPYPIQYNLWALPAACRAAAFGDLKAAGLPCGEPATFEDVVTSSWGKTLTDLFFRPYNEKLWRRRLGALPADCAGTYMPRVDVALAERGCRSPQRDLGYNATFHYPPSAGIGDVGRALVAPVARHVRYGFDMKSVDVDGRKCHAENGDVVAYDHLISTVALPDLLAAAGLPDRESPWFSHTRVANVRVGFRGRLRSSLHWLYVPDCERSFYRIGSPSNVIASAAPAGCASLAIECSVGDDFRTGQAEAIAREALTFLTELGLVEIQDVLTVDAVLIAPAYVVHRSPGREHFSRLRGALESRAIYLAGRFGAWDYLSMDEAFSSGRAAASRLISDGAAAGRETL